MPIAQDGRGQPNPYSRVELAGRVLWVTAYWLIYSWVPRQLNGWHRAVLRTFGAKIGKSVRVYPSARVTCPWNVTLSDYCVVGAGVQLFALGKIFVGRHSVISQRAYICAGSHDYTDPRMPLLRPPVTIGDGVWICSEAYIGPDVRIGDRAVIGARAVATKDMPPDTVCAGNPCRPLKPRVMKVIP